MYVVGMGTTMLGINVSEPWEIGKVILPESGLGRRSFHLVQVQVVTIGWPMCAKTSNHSILLHQVYNRRLLIYGDPNQD